MKWKKGPCEFLSEKTFLILKDDLKILKGVTKTNDKKKAATKNVADTGTWPPKMKRVPAFCENPERPKTANLERPSVLDPELVDKLDMSLLSKELLCDSMTRFHQAKLPVAANGGGKTTTSSSSSSSSLLLLPSPTARERQSAVVVASDVRQPRAATTTIRFHDNAPVRRQRRSFEQIYDTRMICQMENEPRLSTETQNTSSQGVAATQEQNAPVKRNSDAKRLDDNNNRNGPPKVLSTVKKKTSRAGVPRDLEIFTTASAKSAPEPCKACGRPDQPERFHSHPKSSHPKIKDTPTTTKPKNVPMPKSIQKPVALNFRSDKNKNRLEEIEVSKPLSPQDGSQEQASRSSSAPSKRGPKTVTCYICAREFGSASFPIHEPKCMEKWERENNILPPSQRRSKPQRPTVGIEHNDWNAAAWEQSQVQLIPCAKCGRTFLPERLPIHERSCKATPKNNDLRLERLPTADKQANARAGPPTVPCQICGRRFGTRSIKIHEPQCNRRWQMQNDSSSTLHRGQSSLHRQQQSLAGDQDTLPSVYPDVSQKKTVTCYICGRDFGSSSIAIHEPQCLKKWHAENDKLSPSRKRNEPQKPDIVYIQDLRTGNMVIDQEATVEANWMSHLSQLVPCKRCGRTFNPDRVIIHEKSCKGNR